jgi:hypothetical protein
VISSKVVEIEITMSILATIPYSSNAKTARVTLLHFVEL